MAMSTANQIKWKGIVLAGGSGSRLHPITQAVSKQILPVYDKPMIYYPISTLMLGGISDILIISTPRDLPVFRELLGDGTHLGVSFEYAVQDAPRGLPEAFVIGKDFIGDDPVCLILGDNLFYGDMQFFRDALSRTSGATVFGYPVHDPERYGVVEFDEGRNVLSIEEKPAKPKSRYAIPGLYCCDNRVIEIAENLKPSPRGETEITEVMKTYMARGELSVEVMARGIAWLDTGTPQSLLEAANFVAAVEHRQGFKIGCLEEIAYREGNIDSKQFKKLSKQLKNSGYGGYMKELWKELQDRH
jgi:glucose-1-phosphate thymidylyltransferase